MPLFRSRVLSISITRPPAEVYQYIVTPQNLPRWAAGLATGVRETPDGWVTDAPFGTVAIEFAPPNDFGVADHTVTMPDGERILNPMRVTPNGDGSEVSFILFQRAAMTVAEFEADTAAVEADLATLKRNLEVGE